MQRLVTLKGRVTDEMVLRGMASNCQRCPYALALLAAGATRVWAGSIQLCVEVNGAWYGCDTPKEIHDWMVTYDYGNNKSVIPSPAPFELTFHKLHRDNYMMVYLADAEKP